MRLRRYFQVIYTILANSYFPAIFKNGIYTGPLKHFCQPSLNCFSCPLAITSCPIGMLQFFMAELKTNVLNEVYHFGLSVFGFLGIIGTVVGRMQCGWLCPFGFLQDLVYKIPFFKTEIPKIFNYFKYIILALLVFILPFAVLDATGYGQTWFCKYVCPAGTLEAGIPLVLMIPELRIQIGVLFSWKLSLLILLFIWMLVTKRPFCRTICPLGAFYAVFNKISVFKLTIDHNKCVKCDKCYQDCPMSIRVYEEPNQENCIRCLTCLKKSCKFDAVDYEFIGSKPQKTIQNKIPNHKYQVPNKSQ